MPDSAPAEAYSIPTSLASEGTTPVNGRQTPQPAPKRSTLGPANALGYRTPLQEHAPAADTKAAALLTVTGLMFTLVAKYGNHLRELLVDNHPTRLLCAGLLLGFTLGSLATMTQAFRTISPRFPAAPASLAFFGDIARLSREDYLLRMEALSEEEALDQILNFNYTASAICVEKFRQLRRGLRFFLMTFACWLGLVVLLATRVLG